MLRLGLRIHVWRAELAPIGSGCQLSFAVEKLSWPPLRHVKRGLDVFIVTVVSSAIVAGC